MSRTSSAPSPSVAPSSPARDRLARLVTRAATAASSAVAVGLIIPIKWPDALGE